MVAVADPYSVLAVRIARPSRTPRTVTSPSSMVRLAMEGRIDHSASLIREPDESTTERFLEWFTSIASELGVIVTAEGTES